MRRKFLTILIVLPIWIGVAMGMEIAPGLYRTVLDNGLVIIVEENHRAPVVSVQVWVKAGSVYESDKQAGLTHLIEHMIFKGTEKRAPGEIAATIEKLGGSINAFTSYDYTCYHITGPRGILDTALDILYDALFHSRFDPQELEKEKKVVLEEMHMRDDRPAVALADAVMSKAYLAFPYRRPIIGYENTVSGFTREDILSYMSRRYLPCYMAVVIVGDVEAEVALAKAAEIFEKAPVRPKENIEFPKEPPKNAPSLVTLTKDVQEGYFHIALPGPNLLAKEAPVMDVIAALLGQGESSRLYRKLLRKENIVHTVSAYSFTPMGPGLFEVTGTADPKNLRQVIKETLVEIFRLKYEPVLPEELEKAKVMVASSFVYTRETMQGEAQKLGTFEMLANDPLKAKKYYEAVKAVTIEDIREVAQKYFSPKAVVAGLLASNVKNILSQQDLEQLVEEADLEASGVEPGSTAWIVPTVSKKLNNGLKVLITPQKDVPTVSITLIFPGGLRFESKETNGLFRVMTACWTKGTEKYSADVLATKIESMGGRLEGFSGRNTFGLEASFLSDYFEEGLSLFAEVVLHPSFSPEELEKVRPELLAAIARQEDEPLSVALKEFYRLLFSPHPYGLNVLGDPKVIQAITSEDLYKAYRKFVRPDKGVLAIVGDVDVEKSFNLVKKLFEDWRAPASELPKDQEVEPIYEPRISTLTLNREQVHIILGFRTAGIRNSDRFSLEVLNAILAGQGGRLFKELRDKEALAYSVTSFLTFGINTGGIGFYIATSPEKKKIALSGLWREIARINQEGVSQEELDRAKHWLVGRYQTGLQTNKAQAMEQALNEVLGLGYNFGLRYIQKIQNVTIEDIKAVAQKYLQNKPYVLVTVGPAEL